MHNIQGLLEFEGALNNSVTSMGEVKCESLIACLIPTSRAASSGRGASTEPARAGDRLPARDTPEVTFFALQRLDQSPGARSLISRKRATDFLTETKRSTSTSPSSVTTGLSIHFVSSSQTAPSQKNGRRAITFDCSSELRTCLNACAT